MFGVDIDFPLLVLVWFSCVELSLQYTKPAKQTSLFQAFTHEKKHSYISS